MKCEWLKKKPHEYPMLVWVVGIIVTAIFCGCAVYYYY